MTCFLAPEVSPHHVVEKTQEASRLKDGSNADDQIPHLPSAACLVGIDAPWHTEHARNVHEVEGEVEANQEEPEVPLAQCLAHHPARYLGIPVVERSKDGE